MYYGCLFTQNGNNGKNGKNGKNGSFWQIWQKWTFLAIMAKKSSRNQLFLETGIVGLYFYCVICSC
jgi:hypothetical protein